MFHGAGLAAAQALEDGDRGEAVRHRADRLPGTRAGIAGPRAEAAVGLADVVAAARQMLLQFEPLATA